MKGLAYIVLLFICIQSAAQSKFEVFFDFNQDVPGHESGIHLQNWIDANGNAKITEIFGYCDSIDNNSYNKELAARRIKTVVSILEQYNITVDSSVTINPFGEDFDQSPIQAENRKVVIYYTIPVKKKTEEIMLTDLVKDAVPGDIIRLRDMNFFNRSAVMLPKSKPVLDELLCILNDNPKLKIEIQGHICCQTGKDDEGISTARARAVYVFLLRKGIDKKRLSFKGFGSTKPVYPIPERSDEEEEANRRVEIRIVEN